MKRDWDIIRELLLKAEELEPDKTISSKDYDTSRIHIINYHTKLLYESGMIDAIDCCTNDGDSYFINSLTWEGHDFLDSIRNDDIWNKTKSKVIEKGGTMTFDIVKAVAINFIKSSLNL